MAELWREKRGWRSWRSATLFLQTSLTDTSAMAPPRRSATRNPGRTRRRLPSGVRRRWGRSSAVLRFPRDAESRPGSRLGSPSSPPSPPRLSPSPSEVRWAYHRGVEKMFFLVWSCSHARVLLSWEVVGEFLSEAAKYAVPARRFGEPRNLEEALMSGLHSFFLWQQLWSFAPICLFFPFFFIFSNVYWYLQHLRFGLMAVPDLESMNFKVLKRVGEYEIREVESYFIAETTMPGKRGFDFNGSGQAFNVLAAYLFGKNTASEQMEMTTPVFTRKAQADGEKMEMTAPVITRKLKDEDNWQMSFVMPSKYGGNLPTPKDPSVRIREVPRKIVAVAAFSGFVTDDVVKDKELRLRDALRGDSEFRVKSNTPVEVAQFNPPFTLPFTRRNEVSLEVEKRQK